MRLFIFRYDVYTNPFCLFCKELGDVGSLSFPKFSIGNLVLTKPDSRLRHAGMTNNEDFQLTILMKSAKVPVAQKRLLPGLHRNRIRLFH